MSKFLSLSTVKKFMCKVNYCRMSLAILVDVIVITITMYTTGLTSNCESHLSLIYLFITIIFVFFKLSLSMHWWPLN